MLIALGQKLLENTVVATLTNYWKKLTGIEKKKETLNIVQEEKTYDVFLAAPMESHESSGKYKKTRINVLDLKSSLIQDCAISSVYFAGENIKNKSEFDDESLSLEMNLREIKNSKCFILIFPEYKASSTLIEVGMALSLGMESIWFFKKGVTKPFVLRDGADASNRGDLPRISVFEFEDYDDIEAIFKRKKGSLFKTLGEC